MTISQRVSGVRSRLPQSSVGRRATTSYLDLVLTCVNRDPQAKQVDTVTVSTYTTGDTYTLTINGMDVSHVATVADADTTGLAASIAEAINADPSVRGQVAATSAGAVITLTGTYPGIAFTVTEASAKIATPVSVTAAAEADAIAFGRLVVGTEDYADQGVPYCKLAAAAKMVAQVDSYVLVYDAAVDTIVEIEIDGEHYRTSHVMATDIDTSGAAIAAAVNAIMPANTVLATYTAGTDTLTLTSEVAGKPFVSSVMFGAGRDTGVATKTSTAGIDTDLNKAALGVSVAAYDEEVTTVGGTAISYPGNAGLRVLKRGTIWVENSQGVSLGDPVYVELGVTADNGKFFNTGSATRVRLEKARWERASRTGSGDAIAVMRIDL